MNPLVTAQFLPVTISPEALKEIKNIFISKNIPSGYGLRIGIKGAGCSGVSYVLGFDQKKENDDEFLHEGVPVFIEKKHTMYIIGLQVTFIDNTEERGFIFVNPDKQSAEV